MSDEAIPALSVWSEAGRPATRGAMGSQPEK